MRPLDYKGKRFGKLVAVEPAYRDVGRSYRKSRGWLCRCDCGGTIVATTAYLTNGLTVSCGCFRKGRFDLVGQRFGSLVVVSYLKKQDKHRRVFYRCLCDCGKEIERSSRNLREGSKNQSCGCKHFYRRKDPQDVFVNEIKCMYKNNAKNKGYCFDLSIEEIKLTIFLPCHYCGEEQSRGMDRIDNTIGYTIRNIVPCCKTCNYLKKATDYEEFVGHIHKMSNHLKNVVR